jgi:hypothetical protein
MIGILPEDHEEVLKVHEGSDEEKYSQHLNTRGVPSSEIPGAKG